MDSKSTISKMLIRILEATNDGKMVWQINPTKDGYISFLDTMSFEIRPPEEVPLKRIIEMSNSILSKNDELVFQAKHDEVKILVKNLRSGALIFEVAPSLFTKLDSITNILPRGIFNSILEGAKRQIEEKIDREAQAAIDEINKL